MAEKKRKEGDCMRKRSVWERNSVKIIIYTLLRSIMALNGRALSHYQIITLSNYA
jgi:hypothetical protein